MYLDSSTGGNRLPKNLVYAAADPRLRSSYRFASRYRHEDGIIPRLTHDYAAHIDLHPDISIKMALSRGRLPRRGERRPNSPALSIAIVETIDDSSIVAAWAAWRVLLERALDLHVSVGGQQRKTSQKRIRCSADVHGNLFTIKELLIKSCKSPMLWVMRC
jgi:hypothetical protein